MLASRELIVPTGDPDIADDPSYVFRHALVREAVALADPTDYINHEAECRMRLAEVLRAAGRPADAAGEVTRALELFERKGNLVMAERARARLAELAGPAG